jgi:hypothetical protein
MEDSKVGAGLVDNSLLKQDTYAKPAPTTSQEHCKIVHASLKLLDWSDDSRIQK